MIRIATALALVAVATAVQAEPAHIKAARPSLIVATAGLDLTTPQGAQAFQRRLSRAAAEVCGGAPTYGGLDAFASFDTCYRATLAKARAQAPAEPSPPPIHVAGK